MNTYRSIFTTTISDAGCECHHRQVPDNWLPKTGQGIERRYTLSGHHADLRCCWYWENAVGSAVVPYCPAASNSWWSRSW